MREALETLLSQRRQGRAQAALRLAAEALASDESAGAEVRQIPAYWPSSSPGLESQSGSSRPGKDGQTNC
jgi:hypothetical protein